MSVFFMLRRKREAEKKKNSVVPHHPTILAHERPPPENCWNQTAIRQKYESNLIQIAVAGLIFGNFIVSAIEVQMLPDEGTSAAFVFTFFEWFFGLIFTVELIWNMYGSWWCMFWMSGWNWFDFIIVMISLLALAMADLPGISVLRLFRAFRVFRLFKRVPSLKLIIEGVAASLPGVANAFVVVLLLMGIWSIMAVEFFGKATPEFFGDFMRAMFSMWQIMTMDSWASQIGREIIFKHNMPMAALFFISFTFICGIIMTNVVVAILLEKYLDATNKANGEEEDGEADVMAPLEWELDDKGSVRKISTTVEDLDESSPSARGFDDSPSQKNEKSNKKNKRKSRRGSVEGIAEARREAQMDLLLGSFEGIQMQLEKLDHIMAAQTSLEERIARIENEKGIAGPGTQDDATQSVMRKNSTVVRAAGFNHEI